MLHSSSSYSNVCKTFFIGKIFATFLASTLFLSSTKSLLLGIIRIKRGIFSTYRYCIDMNECYYCFHNFATQIDLLFPDKIHALITIFNKNKYIMHLL